MIEREIGTRMGQGAFEHTLTYLKSLTAYTLASEDYAGTFSPDALDSPGAEFLTSVRDVVVESIEYSPEILTGEDGGELWQDMSANSLDATVPVYTHAMWQTFVDLGAYQWESDDPESQRGNMDEQATWLLIQIGERLAAALVSSAREEYARMLAGGETDGGWFSLTEQGEG